VNFSEAIKALNRGKKVRRTIAGWQPHEHIWIEGNKILTVYGYTYGFSWDDVLAEDWTIVD
jgi:hypothetical protein